MSVVSTRGVALLTVMILSVVSAYLLFSTIWLSILLCVAYLVCGLACWVYVYCVQAVSLEEGTEEGWITMGETLSGQPFRIPRTVIQRNHLCLVGESGTGKSVTAAHILIQCAAAGQPIVVVDPKDDRYLARVLYATAKAHQLPMTVIDCRPTAPPQVQPFSGLSVSALRQCLISAWGIQDTGHAAVNYYRAKDREAAELSAALIVREGLCFPEFLARAARIKAIYQSDHFWRLCRDIGTMPVVQTNQGFDWDKALSPGHILYVISSTDDEKVQILTKFIVQRLVYAMRERVLSADTPYATIFIDELRYMLSEVMLNSLSTIRDRRVHLLLAFQDINNLLENPMLNPHAVQSIVTANTGIKCVFRIQHVDTADVFVKMSRLRTTFRKSYHVSSDHQSYSLTEVKEPLVTRDQLMRLPKPAFDGDWCHGYAFFDGQEQAFRNRPMPASPDSPPVYHAPQYEGGMTHIDQLI